MRRLVELVHRRTMAAILAPLALLCLCLLAALGWTTVGTAHDRVINRCADQVLGIARILDVHREIWQLRMRQLGASKDASALSGFWNANAQEVCLESVWSDSGLVGSWPSVDLLPPPEVPRGGWTGVETNPRCEGPVIRTSFGLPEGRIGVVVFRLSELVGKIRPIDRAGSRLRTLCGCRKEKWT